MRLAVVARGLDTKPTGRGLVAREMLRALRRLRPDIEIVLFAGADPGVPAVKFHPARGRSRIQDMWMVARGLAGAISRTQPDLVWYPTHFAPFARSHDVPLVLTLLDVVWRDKPETMDWRHLVTARFGEHCLRHADAIVCISEFTRSRLVAYWPSLQSRARVVHLAPASCPPVDDSENSDRAKHAQVVANVGTVEPRKNLPVLLEAMKQLPDVTLYQYGSSGWNVEALLRTAAAMPNVRFLGYADDAAVRRLYRRAAVAAFPSVYEGFHLPPLEAMSCGCAVIASDIPAHREVLGDAAIYVPANDSQALVTALQHVLRDDAERARRAVAGRLQSAKYSWDMSATRLVQIFEEIIRAKQSGT